MQKILKIKTKLGKATRNIIDKMRSEISMKLTLFTLLKNNDITPIHKYRGVFGIVPIGIKNTIDIIPINNIE